MRLADWRVGWVRDWEVKGMQGTPYLLEGQETVAAPGREVTVERQAGGVGVRAVCLVAVEAEVGV